MIRFLLAELSKNFSGESELSRDLVYGPLELSCILSDERLTFLEEPF